MGYVFTLFLVVVVSKMFWNLHTLGEMIPNLIFCFFAIVFDFNQQPDNYTKFVDRVIHWGRFTGYSPQLCIA